MAVNRALRRLLRIRDLEEEQRRLALEAAVAERDRLEAALVAAAERGRRGRRLITASALSAELSDRMSGIEETRTAQRLVAALKPRLAQMDQMLAMRRQEYLSKRVERRQVETLISETEQRDAVAAERRAQQGHDDWYGNRMFRNATDESPRAPEASRSKQTVLEKN